MTHTTWQGALLPAPYNHRASRSSIITQSWQFWRSEHQDHHMRTSHAHHMHITHSIDITCAHAGRYLAAAQRETHLEIFGQKGSKNCVG